MAIELSDIEVRNVRDALHFALGMTSMGRGEAVERAAKQIHATIVMLDQIVLAARAKQKTE